jgi:hypothetical protein
MERRTEESCNYGRYYCRIKSIFWRQSSDDCKSDPLWKHDDCARNSRYYVGSCGTTVDHRPPAKEREYPFDGNANKSELFEIITKHRSLLYHLEYQKPHGGEFLVLRNVSAVYHMFKVLFPGGRSLGVGFWKNSYNQCRQSQKCDDTQNNCNGCLFECLFNTPRFASLSNAVFIRKPSAQATLSTCSKLYRLV